MTDGRPSVSRTTKPLPFRDLAPEDFELMAVWLIEREGYESISHLGSVGSDGGRDIEAWKGGARWVFQCKRVQRYNSTAAEREIRKILASPRSNWPAVIVFVVSCDLSAKTRQRVSEFARPIRCLFWAGSELDSKVSPHADIVKKFFGFPYGGDAWQPGPYLKSCAEGLDPQLSSFLHLHFKPWQGHRGGNALPSPIQDDLDEIELPQLLRRCRRLLLVGEPGCGKTWLCQRAVATLARRALAVSAFSPQASTPVGVDLGLLGKPYDDLHELLVHQIGRKGGAAAAPTTAALKTSLSEGQLILFLDGLNQVGGDPSAAAAEICALAQEYPAVQVLITCRERGFEDLIEYVRRTGFQVIEVGALTDEDVAEYQQRLESRPPVAIEPGVWDVIPRTPFALRLLTATGETSPIRSWASVVDGYVDYLWNRYAAPSALHLFSHDARQAVELLAFRLLQSERSWFTRQQTRDAFGVHLSSPDSASGLVEELLRLRLLEAEAGRVRFTHEQFLLYFAGSHIARLCATPDRGQRQRNLRRVRFLIEEARWHEAFAFATALTGTDHLPAVLQLVDARSPLLARCMGQLPATLPAAIAALKGRFCREEQFRFRLATTNWIAVALCVLLAATLVASLPFAVGWGRPPFLIAWLASIWLLPDENAPFYLLDAALLLACASTFAGLLAEHVVRGLGRLLARVMAKPIIENAMWLRPADGRNQILAFQQHCRPSLFTSDGASGLLAAAALRLQRHGNLRSMVVNPGLHDASTLAYAIASFGQRASPAEVELLAAALADPRPRVYRSAARALLVLHRRGAAVEGVRALLHPLTRHAEFWRRACGLRTKAEMEGRWKPIVLPRSAEVVAWLRRSDTRITLREAVAVWRFPLIIIAILLIVSMLTE